MKTLVLAFLIAMPLATAFAEDNKKIIVADNAQSFTDASANIRKQMDAGGRFEFIKPGDKAQVNADLDNMSAMLQKSGSVSALAPNDRVKLLNIQEHVNGLLTHSDSERLVCERTNPLGSHIPTTTCRTYGEIEKQRGESQRFLDQNETKYSNVPKAVQGH
jgi:hypothetical protein